MYHIMHFLHITGGASQNKYFTSGNWKCKTKTWQGFDATY